MNTYRVRTGCSSGTTTWVEHQADECYVQGSGILMLRKRVDDNHHSIVAFYQSGYWLSIAKEDSCEAMPSAAASDSSLSQLPLDRGFQNDIRLREIIGAKARELADNLGDRLQSGVGGHLTNGGVKRELAHAFDRGAMFALMSDDVAEAIAYLRKLRQEAESTGLGNGTEPQ